jgi:hypothetical protein
MSKVLKTRFLVLLLFLFWIAIYEIMLALLVYNFGENSFIEDFIFISTEYPGAIIIGILAFPIFLLVYELIYRNILLFIKI